MILSLPKWEQSKEPCHVATSFLLSGQLDQHWMHNRVLCVLNGVHWMKQVLTWLEACPTARILHVSTFDQLNASPWSCPRSPRAWSNPAEFQCGTSHPPQKKHGFIRDEQTPCWDMFYSGWNPIQTHVDGRHPPSDLKIWGHTWQLFQAAQARRRSKSSKNGRGDQTQKINIAFWIPSGNLLHSYWKLPCIVSFPIKNGDFP